MLRTRPGADAARAPRFVFCGRLVPKKGYRQLHALYEALRTRFPDASLDLVLGHRAEVEDAATLRFVERQLATLPGCRLHFDF